MWLFRVGKEQHRVREKHVKDGRKFSILFIPKAEVNNSGIYTCHGVHGNGFKFVAEAEVHVTGMIEQVTFCYPIKLTAKFCD